MERKIMDKLAEQTSIKISLLVRIIVLSETRYYHRIYR